MYQCVPHISSFIKTFTIEDKNYFYVFKNTKNYKMDTEAPIYEQIVQIEAIELHKLSKIIESKSGKVLDLSTDKIICNFPDNILPFELDGDNIIGCMGGTPYTPGLKGILPFILKMVKIQFINIK